MWAVNHSVMEAHDIRYFMQMRAFLITSSLKNFAWLEELEENVAQASTKQTNVAQHARHHNRRRRHHHED